MGNATLKTAAPNLKQRKRKVDILSKKAKKNEDKKQFSVFLADIVSSEDRQGRMKEMKGENPPLVKQMSIDTLNLEAETTWQIDKIMGLSSAVGEQQMLEIIENANGFGFGSGNIGLEQPTRNQQSC